ncbi:MAG: autotransporter outer membrane beta-barrel domain-containing protein, partial [Planctomycetota bacterium]
VVVGGVNTGGCMFGEAGGCRSDICPYCTAGEGDYGPFFIEPGPSTWVRVNGLDADGDTVPGGPIANDVNAVLYQLGYTFPVDSELLFGAVLGYGDTDIDGDLDLGEFDQRTTRVSFYTRKMVGHVFVTAATSYGYDQTILTRQVVAGPLAIETEAGKFDGHEFSSFIELGANLFESRNVTVQPLIGLRYARVFRDADTELGDAPEALIFDSQSEDALEFRLGGRFAKTFRATKAVELIPEVRAWWLHDFQAEVPETTLRLAGLPDVPFVVRGERPDENVAVVGLGVTVVLDNEYALWFQYDGEYGNQTTTNVASAGFLSSW